MIEEKESFFKKLISNVISKPLWVKQAFYVELRDHIKKVSQSEVLESIDKSDLIQLFVPRITYNGEKVIKDKAYSQQIGVPLDVVFFLSKINGTSNIIDLCYEQGWSLKHVCRCIMKAEELGLIDEIRSSYMVNLFAYLAGEVDVGNFLVRINKISHEQLTFADYNLAQMNRTFGESEAATLDMVLVRLGYISQDKLNNLLLLKKASEMICSADDPENMEEMRMLQENVNILNQQNRQLYSEVQSMKPLLESKERKIKQLEEEIKMFREEMDKLQRNPQLMDVFKKL